MSEPSGNVLPIYFVADESGSMAAHIDELNNGLLVLLDSLQGESMAAAKVRFCVIGFDDQARCHLEPSDLRDIEDMPKLEARRFTSYKAAFQALYSRIPRDVATLKSEGFLVNRPAVFFLTDGEPDNGDGWEAYYDDLVSDGFELRPNILAFGINNANAQTIRHIATAPEYAFLAAAGVDTGHAITEFIKALTQSVISSGRALAGGEAVLPIEKPQGFISLSVDTV